MNQNVSQKRRRLPLNKDSEDSSRLCERVSVYEGQLGRPLGPLARKLVGPGLGPGGKDSGEHDHTDKTGKHEAF